MKTLHNLSKLALALSLGFVTPLAFANSPAAAITVQSSDDGIVAKVNDEIILKSEFISTVQAIKADYQARGINLTQEQAQLEAMDALIMQKLQLGLIRRAGVQPNEAVINNELLKIAQSQGFNNLSDFQKSLDSKKMGSYAALRNELIEQAALQALWRHQINNRVNISKQDIDSFLLSDEGKNLNQDEYRTTHARVPFANAQPSNKERDHAQAAALRLKSAFEAGQNLESAMQTARGDYSEELQGADTGYHKVSNLPKELAGVITALQVGDVSAPIATPVGYDVIMLTDKRVGGAVVIPEWQTSHILVKVDANQPKAIAEQKINELYNALQHGANFEELAATYSDDTGSAAQKGALGWVTEDQMVPEFEAVMKNTEIGDYSTPFTSQFGYHILKVNDKRERDVTDTYRRRQAEEILFERQAPKAQEDWLQELRAAAYIEFIE